MERHDHQSKRWPPWHPQGAFIVYHECMKGLPQEVLVWWILLVNKPHPRQVFNRYNKWKTGKHNPEDQTWTGCPLRSATTENAVGGGGWRTETKHRRNTNCSGAGTKYPWHSVTATDLILHKYPYVQRQYARWVYMLWQICGRWVEGCNHSISRCTDSIVDGLN